VLPFLSESHWYLSQFETDSNRDFAHGLAHKPFAKELRMLISQASAEQGYGLARPAGAPTRGHVDRRFANEDEVQLSASARADRTGNQEAFGSGSDAVTSSEANDVSKHSPEEEKVIQELKARDAEVRNHEAAHAAVAGAYGSAPAFEYQRGPDGGSYAIGGHVQIDVSEIPGDPEATVAKMRIVKAAALAPADPSAADLSVAASATQKMLDAQREMQKARYEGDGKGERADTSAESVDRAAKKESKAEALAEEEDERESPVASLAENDGDDGDIYSWRTFTERRGLNIYLAARSATTFT
jgi:hypothetical protein